MEMKRDSKAKRVKKDLLPIVGQYAKVRRMKGISVDDVADKIGMTVDSIRSYENGRRVPSLQTMDLLCRAVGAQGVTIGSGW